VTSDLFAERFAAVRARFASKLDARIDEIAAAIPELQDAAAVETLARAHRRAHDLCGVGPTMGFVTTGRTARKIEQVLLAALKANRGLTADEAAGVTADIAQLRQAAEAEAAPAGRG
jgi:HPt (histidine-containing phosphotransfer) domain-containing protein